MESSTETKETVTEQVELQLSNTKCDGCGNRIPIYPNVPAGFVSPISKGLQPASVSGVPGWEDIPRVVCKNCFREDFSKRYPGQECPI